MRILAIETSCDETAVAVTEERKVLSSVVYSQVLIHKKWGGVVPSLAKRAHEEKIDFVIEEALKRSRRSSMQIFSQDQLASRQGGTARPSSDLGIRGLYQDSLAQTFDSQKNSIDSLLHDVDHIAVTYGPGLAIALEVGIEKAKELAKKYNKKLIPVNHMEGHIYACFAQNSQGNPRKEFGFPYLALLVSGGHTELVLMRDHVQYEVLGETVDDAVGEALDKAGKMFGLGYPAGPVIERLAAEADNSDIYKFPRPMIKDKGLQFSYSGLKTALLYHLKKMSEEKIIKNLKYLASSFQEAAFDPLLIKTERAIKQTGVNRLLVGGGVSANARLRLLLRRLMKKHKGEVLFPPYKYLCTDNAAMIGVAAHYKAQKKMFVKNLDKLDRIPRLRLG